MNDVMQQAQRIIDKAAKKCSRCQEMTLYEGYAEDGYDDPESGVVALGDWNAITRWNAEKRTFDVVDDTPAVVAQKLEKLGVELEWSDEWCSCDKCGKLIRTQANSYDWQPSYSRTDDGYICLGCLDPAEHLRKCVEDGKGNEISDIDPADHGYVQIAGDLENGWYGGQKASPDLVLKSMNEAGVRGVLLNLDSVGQFDMEFSVWVLKKAGKKNIAKAEEVMRMPSKINLKEDPKDALSRGLKAASVQQGQMTGEGIKYSKVNADGTATTRIVSPQEFIEGIKPEGP